jgi:hypothetical protein
VEIVREEINLLANGPTYMLAGFPKGIAKPLAMLKKVRGAPLLRAGAMHCC